MNMSFDATMGYVLYKTLIKMILSIPILLIDPMNATCNQLLISAFKIQHFGVKNTAVVQVNETLYAEMDSVWTS